MHKDPEKTELRGHRNTSETKRAQDKLQFQGGFELGPPLRKGGSSEKERAAIRTGSWTT